MLYIVIISLFLLIFIHIIGIFVFHCILLCDDVARISDISRNVSKVKIIPAVLCSPNPMLYSINYIYLSTW